MMSGTVKTVPYTKLNEFGKNTQNVGNVMLSEGGIIAKAQSGKEKQEVAVWLDRLTVTEANTAVNYYAVDMEKYNEQFATQLQTEFDQMITSVEKYKGFYIGRYSTGNLATNTATEPVVKKGQTAISNVNWYYMYQNSKKIASENSNVATSMLWGCQWDRTLQWLVESGNKTYAGFNEFK